VIIVTLTILLLFLVLGISLYFKYFTKKKTDNREFLEIEEIVFSPHAIQRIHERGISEETVLEIVNNKNSMVNYRFGNRFSLTNGEITVVLSKHLEKLIVVTVYWNKKKRKTTFHND